MVSAAFCLRTRGQTKFPCHFLSCLVPTTRKSVRVRRQVKKDNRRGNKRGNDTEERGSNQQRPPPRAWQVRRSEDQIGEREQVWGDGSRMSQGGSVRRGGLQALHGTLTTVAPLTRSLGMRGQGGMTGCGLCFTSGWGVEGGSQSLREAGRGSSQEPP